jgi:hypothetical protein
LYCTLLWTILFVLLVTVNNTASYCVLLWTVLPYTLFYCDQHYYAMPRTVSQSCRIWKILQSFILYTCYNELVSYGVLGWEKCNKRTVISFITFTLVNWKTNTNTRFHRRNTSSQPLSNGGATGIWFGSQRDELFVHKYLRLLYQSMVV